MSAFPEQPIQWWRELTYDSEAWRGPYATREQAVTTAAAEYFDGHDEEIAGFWIVSGRLQLPSVDNALDQGIGAILDQIEADECWFEDCGIDVRGARGSVKEALRPALAAWMAENVDLSCGRMIEDMLTLEYFRRVRPADGTPDRVEPRPDIAAGDEAGFEGPELEGAA